MVRSQLIGALASTGAITAGIGIIGGTATPRESHTAEQGRGEGIAHVGQHTGAFTTAAGTVALGLTFAPLPGTITNLNILRGVALATPFAVAGVGAGLGAAALIQSGRELVSAY